MTEDLTAALSLIRELLVVSRGVGAAGLDGSTPPDRVAQDLGVRYLLEGSVRVSGERIRVSARLLDSETGGQIWAERFDGVRGDVFAFQDEITRAIAVALQIRLTHGEMARLWDGQTRDLRAWEKFIVGRDIHMSFTEAGNRQGQALLQEALEIDPDYTAAMVMLGITYWEDARDYSSIPPDEALARAEAQAERALALAPGLAGAYSLRGGIAFMRDRHDEAVALCRRACELAPSDPWNHAFLALISIYADEPQVALDALSMAFRLSPHPPGWFFFQKAQAHLWEGALDRAVDAAKRYRALAPDDPYGRALLATIHAFAGREAEAAATIRELRRHDPRFSLADIRRAQRYKDPAKLDRVVEALRRAGLPG